MTAKLPTGLVLFLCFLGSVLAQDDSICNYECVWTDVYRPYCGGAVCVYGAIDDEQREQLCSQECADAIVGSPMRDCVLSQNPNVMNLAGELQNMVMDIRVYCDNAEPSMTAPGSAPASEPITSSSEAPDSAEAPNSAEAPISADAPASSIPIDPPESAPPSEETEQSVTAEPSVAAESFTAVEPSTAVESSIAAEPSVEAPVYESVEPPEAMESEIAFISVASPEEGLFEDDDGEVLEALDML